MWIGIGIGAVVVLAFYMHRRNRLKAEHAVDALDAALHVSPEAVDQVMEAASEAAGEVVEVVGNAAGHVVEAAASALDS